MLQATLSKNAPTKIPARGRMKPRKRPRNKTTNAASQKIPIKKISLSTLPNEIVRVSALKAGKRVTATSCGVLSMKRADSTVFICPRSVP